MVSKLETPCAAPKRGLPWELKYNFAIGGWTDSAHRGNLYAIREKYGAAAALEIYERACKEDDRVKNLTNTILTIFNIKENDAETIGQWWDIWDEFTGIESTILERSKTINRRKVIKCPFKTGYKDISNWNLTFVNIVTEIINSEAIFDRPKAMCAGDSYCEYIWKLEESTSLKGDVEPLAKKLETPCAAPKRGLSAELKYNFAMKCFTDFSKGRLYAFREKYGAAATLEIFDMLMRKGDRAQNLTNTIRTIFKLEVNDAETIGEVLDIWDEICGYESFILERSKVINRRKVIRCPFKVKYHDIGNYAWPMKDIMGKTVNPNSNLEMRKKMCAGDPYCDYIWRIEE